MIYQELVRIFATAIQTDNVSKKTIKLQRLNTVKNPTKWKGDTSWLFPSLHHRFQLSTQAIAQFTKRG